MNLATFQDICSKLSPKYPNREHIDRGYWQAKAAEALSVACEEIERLQSREQQLLLDVDRNYREKKEYAKEIERLQRIISEPVESFGTPELIAWAEGLQKIIADYPEEERGQIPFALTMGCHLEKFAKSWNSPAMQEQAKQIEDRNLIIGHMQATSEIQAKRIAELERIIDIFGPVDGDQLEALLAYRKCKGHDDIATQSLGRAAKAARAVQQLRQGGLL